MLNEALYTYLSAHSGISALVSNRIYPDELPESVTFPAVVITSISLEATFSHEGDSNLDTARVQLDAYAADRATATAILVQCRSALSGKIWAAGGVRVQAGFLANQPPGGWDEALKKWRMTHDYLITYSA
jgi:hypothetical protein